MTSDDKNCWQHYFDQTHIIWITKFLFGGLLQIWNLDSYIGTPERKYYICIFAKNGFRPFKICPWAPPHLYLIETPQSGRSWNFKYNNTTSAWI